MSEKLAKTLQQENLSLTDQLNKLLLKNQELQFQIEEFELQQEDAASEKTSSQVSISRPDDDTESQVNYQS